MLEVRDLHVFYGGIHALRGVSLKVEPGEIVTIIGANGAGKSTLLNAISAVVKRRSGTITLDGQPVASVPTPWSSRESVRCRRAAWCSPTSLCAIT